MSVRTMTWVWDNYNSGDRGASKKLMLLAIADNCNDFGECYPGIARLAKKCDTSPRNAQKIINKLVEDGQLYVDYNDGIETGHGKTNRYYVLGYRKSMNISHPSGELSDTPKLIGVNPTTPQAVNSVTPQGVNPMTPKPSVEPSVEPSVTKPLTPLTSDEPIQSDNLVDEMQQLVKTELKQYTKRTQAKIAKGLLGLLEKGDADYNISEPITPEQFKKFCLWWDKNHTKDGKGLTRPKNLGSVKSNVERWLDECKKPKPVTIDRRMQARKLPVNIAMLNQGQSA